MPAPIALVAGASRGLGLLIARQLGRRGFTVAICARDEEDLKRAADLPTGAGCTALPFVCDVRDEQAVTDSVQQLETSVGPIEVAIHVAGVIQVMPLDATRQEHFDDAIAGMLKGPIHLALAVLPAMRTRGRGRIGTVNSIGGAVSVPHLLPYCSAKFGAVGFSRGLSAELAGTGITSTTIVPGLMRTGSHLHAQFGGDPQAKYAWFAPSASLPGLTMDAGRAAERIVSGVLSGRNQVVLTPLAQIGVRVAGLALSLTTSVMKVAATLLPSADDRAPDVVEGEVARARLSSPVVEKLTVRVTSTAICGSDLHLYNVLAAYLTPGDILGHEFMGIVEEVGSAVGRLSPGDRVVVPFTIACGHCWMCERQLFAQCETTQNRDQDKGASLFGYTSLYGAVPGGQAELVRVPHADFGPIRLDSPHPDERFLFLSDILPTAWQAVTYADVPQAGSLLVLGLGPVGLMAVRSARQMGIEQIIGVDREPARLRAAGDLGAVVLELESLTTHRAPLDRAAELYDVFARKEDDCIKVVLSP